MIEIQKNKRETIRISESEYEGHKFIDLRIDSHAQWEIQKVAEACKKIATDLWPIAMGHFKA